MSTKLELPLEQIFEKHSLKLYTTIRQQAMPITGRRFYVWNEFGPEQEISKVLEMGKKWNVGGNSINNYIDLQEPIYEIFLRHCFNQGPNSNALIQTIHFMHLHDGSARVLANGWGNSYVVLWDGPPNELLNYLNRNQRRSDEPNEKVQVC